MLHVSSNSATIFYFPVYYFVQLFITGKLYHSVASIYIYSRNIEAYQPIQDFSSSYWCDRMEWSKIKWNENVLKWSVKCYSFSFGSGQFVVFCSYQVVFIQLTLQMLYFSDCCTIWFGHYFCVWCKCNVSVF